MSGAAEPVGAASDHLLAVDETSGPAADAPGSAANEFSAAAERAANPSPAADFSLAILRAFVGLGVTDAVLTPGSRSQALALALAEFDRAGMLALQVRLDERVAGFTALGLGVETRLPAIIVTTSGTAVANLLPAVLEAHHSRVPMLIVTADRPAAMRGTAGNQTTHQPGIFGRFVRRSLDVNAPSGLPGESALAAAIAREAFDAALGADSGDPGPVHVNLQFREPLSGTVPDLVALLASGEWMTGVASAPGSGEWMTGVASAPGSVGAPAPGAASLGEADGGAPTPTDLVSGSRASRRDLARLASGVPSRVGVPPLDERGVLVLERGPRTVVIAGHDAGPAAEQLAHDGGWPLISEPSSGARYGRNLVVAYRELLNDPELGGRIQRAIVFGHPTLSREVPALSLRDDVETIVVTPAAASVPPGEEVPDVFNPGHRVQYFVSAVDVAPAADPSPRSRAAGTASRAAEPAPGDTTTPAAPTPPAPSTPTATSTGAGTSPATSTANPASTADVPDADGDDRRWLRDWVLASRALVESQAGDDPVAAPNIEAANSPDIAERRAYRLAETAALKEPITRRTLALAVWQATWPHDRLVLGASRLIRDLDRVVPGKKIRVHANRGLAGIDGTIATATGIALASQTARPAVPSDTRLAAAGPSATVPLAAGLSAPGPGTLDRATITTGAGAEASADARPRSSGAPTSAAQHGVTRVLLGDLTLLHDAGALLFGTGEQRPRIQVIVANDNGGTIFDTLEVAATANPAAFDRVMLTPQTVDVEALAKAYGWSYLRATTRPELDRALIAPLTGPTILEIPLTR